MSTAARAFDLESYWEDLKDPGKRREFLRLPPTPTCPVTTSATGASGWQLAERSVYDLSLGGVGLQLNLLEARAVRVGESVRLLATLGDREFNMHGRSVNLNRTGGTLWPKYLLGIEFVGDGALQHAFPYLVKVLHQLNWENGKLREDIR